MGESKWENFQENVYLANNEIARFLHGGAFLNFFLIYIFLGNQFLWKLFGSKIDHFYSCLLSDLASEWQQGWR